MENVITRGMLYTINIEKYRQIYFENYINFQNEINKHIEDEDFWYKAKISRKYYESFYIRDEENYNSYAWLDEFFNNMGTVCWYKDAEFLHEDVIYSETDVIRRRTWFTYFIGLITLISFCNLQLNKRQKEIINMLHDYFLHYSYYFYSTFDDDFEMQKQFKMDVYKQDNKLFFTYIKMYREYFNKPIYYLDGIRIPDKFYNLEPNQMNIDEILKVKDIDARAVLIKKYGIDNLINFGKVVDTYQNYMNSKNYKWYEKSQYRLIDMSPVFEKIHYMWNGKKHYMPYLYMKNQTVPGIYHLECCYNDKPYSRQPKTIIQALKVRLNGMDPEKLDLIAIK